MSTDISQEPLQNLVAKNVGSYKAWRFLPVDPDGNDLVPDSLVWEIRFDYGTRTDGQPVYIGYAPSGTLVGDSLWLLHKFTYDTSNNVTRREVAVDKDWTNRAIYF